ncbi:MAG: hypothetical protein HC902_15020 [Calothrix sp. SM1_5_4]|nr:hypothetical protein [Calothrix sp. SM1_5_4]
MIRWILDLAGVDASDLSASLMANDSLIGTPGLFFFDLLNALYENRPDLFQGVSVSRRDLGTGSMSWLELDCSELRSKSLALQNVPRSPSGLWRSFRDLSSTIRPVISRCAKCHSEGLAPVEDEVPEIPFHDSALLAERIRNPRDNLGQLILKRIESRGRDMMPPDRALSPEESAAMREFIEVLK